MAKKPIRDFAVWFNPCTDPTCNKMHIDVFRRSGEKIADDPKQVAAALRFAADMVQKNGLPPRARTH